MCTMVHVKVHDCVWCFGYVAMTWTRFRASFNTGLGLSLRPIYVHRE